LRVKYAFVEVIFSCGPIFHACCPELALTFAALSNWTSRNHPFSGELKFLMNFWDTALLR